MKIKRFLLILIAAILVLSGCGDGGPGEYDIPDFSQSNGEIKILAWDAPGYGPPPNYNFYKTEVMWQWVAEAGYNYILPLTQNLDDDPPLLEHSINQLDWAAKYGMKMFVTDVAMANARVSAGNGLNVPSDNRNVSLYKDHPAFYGIYISDEPSRANWGFANDRMEECKREFGNDKLFFLNTCFLTTIYPSLDVEYDELFERMPNLNILSYDGYAMMDDGTVLSSFLSDMAIVRYYAKNYNVLSCNFILVSGGYDRYRLCSEEDILWQMNVMLAYGYDFIAHFTYASFSTSEKMVTDDGERTSHYYKVQSANYKIRSIEKIYTNFEWQGTAVIEGENMDSYDYLCESIPVAFIEEETPGIQKIESDENLLCGIFKDSNNNMAYMLTSAINPYRDLTTTAKVKFDRAYKGIIVLDNNYNKDDDAGWGEIIPLVNGECTITLKPGEGKFVIPLKYK